MPYTPNPNLLDPEEIAARYADARLTNGAHVELKPKTWYLAKYHGWANDPLYGLVLPYRSSAYPKNIGTATFHAGSLSDERLDPKLGIGCYTTQQDCHIGPELTEAEAIALLRKHRGQELVPIYARAANGVIGKGNKLPWSIPEDLQRFKDLTMHYSVLMGRKTWESLPTAVRPLPGRVNVVVTRQVGWTAPGAVVVHSVEEALEVLKYVGRVFVIGGAELFSATIPLAQRMEVTELEDSFEGDVTMAPVDLNVWIERAREPGMAKAGPRYSFVTYERR